jgi:hypothetical protein
MLPPSAMRIRKGAWQGGAGCLSVAAAQQMSASHAAATSACDEGNRRRLKKPPSHYNIAPESPQSACVLDYPAHSASQRR